MGSIFAVLLLALAAEASYRDSYTSGYAPSSSYQAYDDTPSYQPDYKPAYNEPKYGSYEPKQNYGYPAPEPAYPSQSYDDYQAPDQYGGSKDYNSYPAPSESYKAPADLLSNGVGTVISIHHKGIWCDFKNYNTYRSTSHWFDSKPAVRVESTSEEGDIIILQQGVELDTFRTLMAENREPAVDIDIDNKAFSDSFALNSNNINNTNKLDNRVDLKLDNTQRQDQISKQRQDVNQLQLGVVKGKRGIRPAHYTAYSYCKVEWNVALSQLSGKREWLVKYEIEGYKIIGGYANVPDTGTRMFNHLVKAPAVSTYGDNYGALGYAKDKYNAARKRRSAFYGEKNGILTIWGWAKFCKPKPAYPQPYGYDRPDYNRGYGYQKRSAYNYGQECWKEGIDISMELDYPKQNYVHSKLWALALDNDNVLVSALAEKEYKKPSYRKPSYRKPAYPQRPEYPQPSYPSYPRY